MVWKTRKILPKSHYACAVRNVCLLCSEEYMAEGGSVSGPQGIFRPSMRTKSEVWAYFCYYKNAQRQLVEDGSPICRSCKKKVVVRGGNTSSLCDHHQLFSKCKVS